MRFGIVFLAMAAIALLTASTARAIEIKSFIDKELPLQFLVDHFDLSTIRSSFGPQRVSGKPSYFKNMGLNPTSMLNGEVVFDKADWFYKLKILGIDDFNKDGFEDMFICFTDKSKVGSYDAVTPFLLTRYNDNMPLIALSYAPYDQGCVYRAQ